MKIKLIFSYDGSRFQGSATQPHANSVQDTLLNALTHLGIFERPLFASRTDKGVHSLGAVASVRCGEHFDDLTLLKNQLNRFAHPHIHIKRIEKVSENFEVRFDAKMREYRYILHHGEFSSFLAPYFHFYPKIDIQKANEILAHFIGTHDFKLFQKQNEPNKDTVRTVFKAKVYNYKNLTIFVFRANGFLRAQIRFTVATVLKALAKKLSQSEILEQINAQKAHIRTPAPPNGLYLTKILY